MSNSYRSWLFIDYKSVPETEHILEKLKGKFRIVLAGQENETLNYQSKTNIIMTSKHVVPKRPPIEIADEVFYLTKSTKTINLVVKYWKETPKILSIVSKNKEYETFEPISIAGTLDEIISYLLIPYEKSKRIYHIDGFSGEPRIALHSILRSWKLAREPLKYDKIDFMMLEKVKEFWLDKPLYYLNCVVKNRLYRQSLYPIINKLILYSTIKDTFPETYLDILSESWNIENFPEDKSNDVMIIRCTGFGAVVGKGIFISSNKIEFQEIHEIIKANKLFRSAIVSRYIRYPLLWQGRKFHFRVHYIITSNGTWSRFHRPKIVTSEKQYDPNEFDPSVSDTHVGSTPREWEFPNSVTNEFTALQMEQMTEGIDKICEMVFESCKNTVLKNPESDYSYNLFGLDIMFEPTENGVKSFLLEVNSKIGLYPAAEYTEEFREWTADFMEWQYKEGILPGLQNKI